MKTFTLTIIVLLTIFSDIFAQAPQGITYQGVARSKNGKPIIDQKITVKFSIIKNNVSGPVEYAELHTLTTNSFGLFTTSIGNGKAITGKFSAIKWSNVDKFLKVEIDFKNKKDFEVQGVSQLLSVPFAFFAAKTAWTDSASFAKKASKADTASFAKNIIYTAGTGISIVNNKISNTQPSRWSLNNNNLSYVNGTVSIGSSTPYLGSVAPYKFTVKGGNSPAGDETVMFTSDSPWETQLGITNSTSQAGFFFNVTGVTNKKGSGNFNIVRSKKGSTFPFTISRFDYVGINQTAPTSSLEVNGNIELSEVGNGIIMRSPNGTCFKVTIDDNGNFIRSQIECPQ